MRNYEVKYDQRRSKLGLHEHNRLVENFSTALWQLIITGIEPTIVYDEEEIS